MEDDAITAMTGEMALRKYGYVVKSSSPKVLEASIKMAFRLFDPNGTRSVVTLTVVEDYPGGDSNA